MSNGLDRILDDMSQTKGTPFVSGINGNSTPKIIEKIIITIFLFFIELRNNYHQQFHYRNSRRTRRSNLTSKCFGQEW